MNLIVERSARILDITAEKNGIEEIAQRSRGTPRVANRLLKRVRDYAQVKADSIVTGPVTKNALERLEIDNLGLDSTDYLVLKAIIEKFDGGPVGLSNLAAVIGEEADTIEEVVEPYLIKEGFVKRTPKGRVAMPRAWERLGIDPLEGESGGEQLGLL